VTRKVSGGSRAGGRAEAVGDGLQHEGGEGSLGAIADPERFEGRAESTTCAARAADAARAAHAAEGEAKDGAGDGRRRGS
jgi:hypothetical protein